MRGYDAAHAAPTYPDGGAACWQEITELEALEDFRTPTSRIASFLKLSAAVPETLVAITFQRDTAQP